MVSFGFSLCFLFFHLVVTIFVCLFVFSVVAVVISINYMPSTILGRGGRTVPNHAEWGDMRHKPSHLIRHMKNRDLKKRMKQSLWEYMCPVCICLSVLFFVVFSNDGWLWVVNSSHYY